MSHDTLTHATTTLSSSGTHDRLGSNKRTKTSAPSVNAAANSQTHSLLPTNLGPSSPTNFDPQSLAFGGQYQFNDLDNLFDGFFDLSMPTIFQDPLFDGDAFLNADLDFGDAAVAGDDMGNMGGMSGTVGFGDGAEAGMR